VNARRRFVFIALVAVQALVPLGLIGWNELALARGTEVTLRTVPIDPIDLFRGRYVTLSYEISRVPVDPGIAGGATVYVRLRERDGGVWAGDRAARERPAGGTFIRGTYTGSTIRYGIETYYADEDEAPRLEAEARRGLDVRVVLDDDGRARISGVEAVR
jgi:uncharacterized membrane-anchored protein